MKGLFVRSDGLTSYLWLLPRWPMLPRVTPWTRKRLSDGGAANDERDYCRQAVAGMNSVHERPSSRSSSEVYPDSLFMLIDAAAFTAHPGVLFAPGKNAPVTRVRLLDREGQPTCTCK